MNTVMNKKNGFSLIEILVVMAILIIMVTVTIGIFNSSGVTSKGRDALRKKDLNRIKIAFEEYYNDKGYFPQDVVTWNIKENCKTGIFKPYLNPWPCDINGNPYRIIVAANEFRIIVDLENKKDKDIPTGWYESGGFGLRRTDVNYGVSSSNILWYDTYVNPICDPYNCFSNVTGTCESIAADIGGKLYGCTGPNCYYREPQGECLLECKTNRCVKK